MSFTSAVFLIVFFPMCIIFAYLIKKEYRNIFLCIMSALFYFWCGIKFLILILFSATIAYLCGILIEKAKTKWIKRLLLVVSLVYNLGILFFYKYLFALFPNAISVWSTICGNDPVTVSSIALPLGISFYTFSALSYVLDVYWQKCEAQTHILNIYLYVLFFPKVVQGPIMRHTDFALQIHDGEVNLKNLDRGFERFIKGMFKKVMIADLLQPLVTYSFFNIENIGTIPAWIGITTYLLQLYYDFSGYSDMAIGLGLMVGFELPENFDHPYISRTVAEFWRRWHISLGEWFRDYVYMPCSLTVMSWDFMPKLGKRKILFSDIVALFVTWLLTGIWHGSGSKFLIWGLWWFCFIAFERLKNNHRKKIRKAKKLPIKKDTVWQIISDYVITFFAVVLGQVIFRADSMSTVIKYWNKMFVWNTCDGITFVYQFDNYMVFALVIGLVFIFPIYDEIKNKIFLRNTVTQLTYRLFLIAVAFISFCYAITSGYSAFLYEVF